MFIRNGEAEWRGALKNGSGRTRTESGTVDARITAKMRFGNEKGTNPEELIAAAHASCYSMALANHIATLGFAPERIQTRARVHLQVRSEGAAITQIDLTTEAEVPGMSEDAFREAAQWAKDNCPVSRVLRPDQGISLQARLVRGAEQAA